MIKHRDTMSHKLLRGEPLDEDFTKKILLINLERSKKDLKFLKKLVASYEQSLKEMNDE